MAEEVGTTVASLVVLAQVVSLESECATDSIVVTSAEARLLATCSAKAALALQ